MSAELIAAICCVVLSIPLSVVEYRRFTRGGHR